MTPKTNDLHRIVSPSLQRSGSGAPIGTTRANGEIT
jgi:hypothetical protein